jgi:hypothetical protein
LPSLSEKQQHLWTGPAAPALLLANTLSESKSGRHHQDEKCSEDNVHEPADHSQLHFGFAVFARSSVEIRIAAARRLRLCWRFRLGILAMTGPRPAGRPWTLTDDDMLRKLLGSGMKVPVIALKMNRTVGAIQSRKSKLKAAKKK